MNVNLGHRLAIGLATAMTLSGCGISYEGNVGDPSEESAVQVAAAFYPLQYAATSVGGEMASVSSLTTPGIEPHDVELTPRQVAAATQADLVVYLSGFQPAVDEAVRQTDPAKVLDVAEFADLKGVEESLEAHDEATDDEEGHDHGDMDPHFWLDPQRLAAVEGAIAERLKLLRPEQTEAITSNATTATSILSDVDEEFSTGLERCARRELFTSHSAFGYLAGRYDLQQVGVAGISPNIEPSPARIAEVQQLAREYGATTIFFETAASDAVAASIATDLGLETAVLDPIETPSDQSAGEDYPAIMRANLAAIQKANDCA